MTRGKPWILRVGDRRSRLRISLSQPVRVRRAARSYTVPSLIQVQLQVASYASQQYSFHLREPANLSRSGLVSEAETDEEIVLLISAASPAQWLGQGAQNRTGRCYSSRDSLGASAARQGPAGFDDSGQQSRPVSNASRGIRNL